MRSKNAIYNIVSNIFLQIITIIYGFIVPKIIINAFGSNVNGLISSITQFLSYIILLESGFGPVVKAALYKPIANKNKTEIICILKTAERFFRAIAYIFLIYIFVLCLLYPILVSKDFNWLYTSSLIIIIGISIFAEYFFGMTYRLFLQANQKTYIISIIQIVTYVISTGVIVVMANLGVSIHILKLVSGIIFVLRPILQNVYVKKRYNINYISVKNKYDLKQKWDGLAQHIAAVIHGNTDITILTIFTTLSEVSVYSVYYLVVKGVKSIIQAFSSGIDAIFGDMIAKNEIENLNKKFNLYELIYYSLATILFTSSIVLIVPFIMVYCKNIVDANYIRYTFGVLIVISEYIWAIRLPYSSIIIASGHFKETRIGAWIECSTNIIISIFLVRKYGLVGVTIGTIIAMTIRTVEFVYHSNKYILYRSMWKSILKIILIIIESIIIITISNYLPYLANVNYLNWIINSLMVVFVASIITLGINYVVYNKEFKDFYLIISNLIKRKNGRV